MLVRQHLMVTFNLPASTAQKDPARPITMTMFTSLIDEIQDTAVSGQTNKQLRALTRITNLFTAGAGHHSKKQIELFDEVFKTLVAVIELETRIKLARRVATIPDAPAALVRAFAFDDAVAVAGPVLSQSTALSDSDLVANARTQGQGHLEAIAHRKMISEVITEILIERGEPHVVHTVARNAGARFSDGSFRELVARAGDDAQLALHVGVRHDIPRHHFLKLLETASASVCARMLAANPQFADAVQHAVTEVIDDINLEVRSKSPDHVKAKSRVKRLQNWHELGEGNVHAAARAQNFEQAAMALSVLACCPIETAERAILNENPGVVQVIAKAAGCSWATVKLLLLMNAANRRMGKKDLAQAREDYERLETSTAKRVLEFHQERRNVGPVASPAVVSPEPATVTALAG
jgi:uncharacterized protein (DUF2336 family)